MKIKQLIVLCLCMLVVYSVGNTLFALLPVYSLRIGAEPGAVGAYLALAFTGITVGTMIGGRLADRYQRRKLLLIVSGVLFTSSVLAIRAATDYPGLVVTTVLTWFSAGGITSAVTALTGLYADEAQRGRIFGLVNTFVAMGAVVAGVVGGRLVVDYGYPGMLLIGAVVSLIIPFAALFVDDKVVPVAEQVQTTAGRFWQGRIFLMLVAAYLVASVVNGLPGLARPLLMDRLGFDEAAIASTLTVSGLAGLSLPIVMGWLSDRVGRKWLLIISYAANTIGLALYIPAVTLGHFWLAVGVQSIIQGGNGVGQAMITDQVPKAALGQALAVYGSAQWVGFVIGLFSVGYAIEQFGVTASLLGGVAVGIVPVLLVFVAARPPRQVNVATEPA